MSLIVVLILSEDDLFNQVQLPVLGSNYLYQLCGSGIGDPVLFYPLDSDRDKFFPDPGAG
jgi:hypothetical protein